MFPTPQRTNTRQPSAFIAPRFIALLLIYVLVMQTLAPPAFAAPKPGFAFSWPDSHNSLLSIFKKPKANKPATAATIPMVQPATEEFGVVLTPLNTSFAGHVGIEHHQPLRKLVVSANNPSGMPNNFESLDADGTHRPHSNVAGLTGGLKIATARDSGTGMSLGGFNPGELFSGTGVPGVIARIAADGATIQNPWVTLDDETGLDGGLFIDRTGVFGGDLIVVTSMGGVWRVTAAGAATRIANLNTPLEGVTTVPNDEANYGPWAGKILAGAKTQNAIYAIDAQGASTSYPISISPQDIQIIPAHENFYGIDPAGSKIWGAPDDAFAGIIGDILIAQGSPGVLLRVSWNGSEFEAGQIAQVSSWKQITFSPAALSQIEGVKQFYDKIAVVRHAPELNSGRVEGALWQLLPENLALDGTDVITSDLLVPGTPTVTIGSGNPTFGGVIPGVENTQPTGYSITISNNAHLRHVITRTNPISLMPILLPPAPSGTRDVSLTEADETIGDPATLRHLSISGKAGAVVVPPGTYGRFAASGHTAFVLGVEGTTVPSVYNLEELSLLGGSELRVVGPVKLTVKTNVTLVGSAVGAPDDPTRLLLQVAQGTVSVSGNAVLYGIIRNPQGMVSIPGTGRIRGTVTCDRLFIDGNGILQIVYSDVAPPPVNRPPTVDAGPDQTITLPTDTVSLNGIATDDGLPVLSTLVTTWTKVSGPGPVTFSNPDNPVTSATFTEPGTYVLRLTANDSLLTVFDEMSVEVIPRNQPPEVNAGPDQTIELPHTATMAGVVTDDGLPRGSTVTRTWSVVNGPGAVTFADVHDLSTVVTFAAPGDYTLRLTANDTEFTVSDDVVITVHPENQPPVVNAGPDQTVRLPAAVTLNGSATDDGWPFGSTLTTSWTKVSGPGAVTFANAASPVTTAQFSIEGTYVLRLTADDSRFTVSDECTITVLPANTPPVVNAGPDQQLTFLQSATLNGTANDDGLPVGSVVEVGWTKVSGPGTVTFGSPENPISQASFSAPGTYVLRLTGTDSQFSAEDEATIVVNPLPHASKVYTLNADFDLGSMINLTHNPAEQLQLDETSHSFKFMWVAVSTKGTVVKINTETGQIIGEYFTSPNGQPRDPSRTTVDHNGNVWNTNRAGNSVVHIGLVENGQCVDRNGNGVIDTSTGFNNIRPWTNAGNADTNGGVSTAQDECILHYTRVNSFGTRHVAVNTDNDIWVSGTSGQRFDLIDGVTGQIKRAELSVGFGGYGGLIDRNGVIWSANPMLRWDTSKPLNGPNGVNWRGYSHPSYGLCIDSLGNVYNTSYGNGTIRKFSPDGTLIGSFNQGSPWSQGCVVDRNDHVWIAHSLNTNTVGHMKSNGVYIGTITVGSGPTGVAVDGDGKIWSTNYNSRTVSRINPALGPIGGDGVTRVGAVEFTTIDLGGNPYNYSDMTGSTLTGAPNTGTWSVVFDSQLAGADWSRIGWTTQVCSDGLITVSLATSTDNVNFSTPVIVSNGADPVVPNGRYARITVRLDRATTGETPILYDLSIGTVGFPLDVPANVAPGVDAGPDQTLDGVTQATLNASVCDDALPSNQKLSMTWSKVSGPGTVTFAKPNLPDTTATFSAIGTYTLRFTASDSVHTTSDTLVVTVLPGNQAPVVNAGADVTVDSCNATLNGTVTDDGKPANGTLLITWNKLNGPGVVTFASPNSASTGVTFSKAGVYVLRLSAGDGALGGSDDVIVTVRASGAPFYYELTNYLSVNNSPFRNLNNTYFHLENFEDHLFNTPGVTTSAGGVTSVVFGPSAHDSVDADDGAIDGTSLAGDGYFSANAAAGIKFTFNAAVLGSLPTHAGLVWTDGAGTVSFEAFDSQGVSMGVRGPFNLPDGSNFGTTAEDTFFGVYNRGGISAIRILNTVGGIEIDHLQYGFEHSDNNAPSVSAGEDQAIYLPDTSVTLNGSGVDDGLPACGGSLTYAWTKVSGPGTVTFAPANAAVTTATFSTPGVYVLRLTGSDSELSNFDEVTVRFNQPNQAPVVNAGPDQTIALNGTANLNGSVTDDGLPINSTVQASWTMVSGPGLVNFDHSASAVTTATFTEAGVYILRLSATDSLLSASDETVITVTPPNGAPVVNAGADLAVTLPGTARLNGSVTDDGLPTGGALTVAWSQVSGPGTTTFANAAASVTTATFSAAGTYVLRLSASDSELTGSNDVTVTVNPAAPNQAPVVEAGANQSVQLNANLVQNGGNDESLVNGEIRAWTEAVGTTWTRAASGANGFPESVNGGFFFYAGETASAELRQDIDVSTFAATIAAGTQAFALKSFVRSGAEATPDTTRVILEYRNAANTTMIARLDSGEVSSTSAWQLIEDTRIVPAGTGWIRIRLIATRRSGTINDAYFDALSFRPVTGSGVKLNGVVTDDGLPAGGALTVTWSKVSGPGTVTFANANAASTSAVFTDAGTYVLRLTADDSAFTNSDELTVTVEAANLAPVVNAGADQTITLPANASLSGSVTDDGKPAGASVTSSWSKVSGPGTVTFADASAASTTATFSLQGTYVLRLTADDTEYISSDTITVTVNPVPPNQAPTVNAGADQVIQPPATSATLVGTVNDDGLPPSSSLTYLWTKVSGPGNVTFSNPTSLTTNATFSEAGAYILRLTANDSALSGSDDVRVTLNGTNKAPVVNAGADQTVAHPTTVNLNGTATDDGLPVDSTLSFSWSKVSGPGTVTFGSSSAFQTTAAFSVAGTYVLRLTATDTALSTSDDLVITQTAPPTANINSPASGSTITGATNFIGTVSDGSTWRLEYSLNEDGVAPVWTTVASGNTPVNNGLLGIFDPTVLLNGIYTVRLVATNSSGQTTTTSVTAVADGEQKVGNFSLSFRDLSVPVAGIPIDIIRTYDSRDKRVGDFGVGWNIDIRNARLQESTVTGTGWATTVSGGFLPSYCVQATRPHIVTITMSNNEVFKFEVALTPQCGQVFPLRETTIGFRALPGTNATLTPVGDATVFINASYPGEADLLDYSTFEPKDFDQYRLTLPSGDTMLIDQQGGIRQLTDANNNTLTINSNGITHSSGKSVTFTRDSLGRITQITDPAGVSMTYSYDARGDLITFKDRETNQSTYTYNSSHGLLTITDPTGNQPLRNEYDENGRLVRQIDAFGKIININVNPALRQEVVTDRLGHSTIFEYNARGQVVRTTDANGGVTTRTFDSRDNLISETNAEGKVTTYTYDALDNRLSETDPLGNITRFTYNSRRQLLTVTDALGRATTCIYDTNGNLTSVRDTAGNTTTATYNSRGQKVTMTDPLNRTTTFEYDTAGNLTKQTDPSGNVVTFTYDANNNRLTETVVRGGGLPNLTTTYEYDRLNRLVKTTFPNGTTNQSVLDSAGRRTKYTDALGNETDYGYDAVGQLTSTTYEDGLRQEFTYDAQGRRTKVIDRAGRATDYTYDALGRITKTTFADGTFTSLTYSNIGQILSSADALGNLTRYEYDAAGRQTKVTDRLGNVTTFTYDGNGNRTSMLDGRGQLYRYEYDASNHQTKIIYPNGSTQLTAYNTVGQVISKTDQAGRVTQFEYEAQRGNIAKVIDALNGTTTFTYDQLGNLLTQTDANNHTTRYEYDALGRRTKRTLPVGMFETFAYDNAGRLTSRTDFRGKTTTYAYDVMNRLMSKTPDASLAEPNITYTYTATGQRATMTDASGQTTYTYDSQDRLTNKQTPQGTLVYTYDAAGNVLTLRSSNADGVSVDYTYDALGRLASVKDNRSASALTTYTYDGNGNLASTLLPNGVQTSYTYDTLNRLTQLGTTKAAATVANYSYTLAPNGLRLSVAEHGGRNVSYTYDALNRLTSEVVTGDASINGSIGYSYDAVGNRLTRTSTIAGVPATTATYDANDRLNSDTYDPNGNTLASNGSSYTYDFENRMTGAAGGTITIVYDGDGNRVAKTSGGVTTRYLVDTNNHTGHAQVAEELRAGQVVRQYTYGHDLISERQQISGQWQTSYYGYDGQGSVRYLTNAAGAVTDTYTYDAFGNLTARVGTTPNDYLFAGEQFDPDLNLYYLRARYLNQSTGRFVSADTFEGFNEDPQSLHKYTYAHNDPVNFADPSGNFEFSIAGLTMNISIQSILSGIAIGALRGAVFGAIIGAADAALAGDDIVDGFINGLAMGALLGPLARVKVVLPILQLFGLYTGITSAADSFAEGNSAQGVFRAGLAVFTGLALFRTISGLLRAPGFVRAPQDIGRESNYPNPPPANDGAGTIGTNANRTASLERDVRIARFLRATDIRVNQEQVNAQGTRVGVNRPDLQFTLFGRLRVYIEYDPTNPVGNRGPGHNARTLSNDPGGLSILKTLD
ncbi:MAG TPA: RHS repeat-associated core domain-containing protein [Pyrinomonadaceae bacterium]|nr:RHS repeat-associated core domain-containing protein [Pyrinomonadaceae bacterium]